MSERRSVLIVPNDDNDLQKHVTKIYVGSAGNIKIKLSHDMDSIVLINVPSGSWLELVVSRVYKTDTTATNLIGFYS